MENSIDLLLRSSNGRRQVRSAIVGSVARVAGITVPEVHDDLELAAIGLDSLSFSEVLVRVEDELGDEIPEHLLLRFGEATDLVTMADLYRLFGLDVDERRWESCQVR